MLGIEAGGHITTVYINHLMGSHATMATGQASNQSRLAMSFKANDCLKSVKFLEVICSWSCEVEAYRLITETS